MNVVNHPTKKSVRRLFIIGLSFIPIAYLSDCVLDAILFSEETFLEQILSPSFHEICIRALFSTFIMGVALYGCHLLEKALAREVYKDTKIQKLEKTNLEIIQITHAFSKDLRGMILNTSGLIGILEENCKDCDNEILRGVIEELQFRTMHIDDFFNDLHQLVEKGNATDT
jgi:hypothetical protein